LKESHRLEAGATTLRSTTRRSITVSSFCLVTFVGLEIRNQFDDVEGSEIPLLRDTPAVN